MKILWTFMKISSDHIIYCHYHNQYYHYTTKTYLQTLNMSQHESIYFDSCEQIFEHLIFISSFSFYYIGEG